MSRHAASRSLLWLVACALPLVAGADDAATPARLKVRDDDGRPVVGRVVAGTGGRLVLLPDGQFAKGQSARETDEPFVPESIESLAKRLGEEANPPFHVLTKPHYLVLYRGGRPFAASSANLLESLYVGLSRKLKEKGLPVREAEFPLVAVIYKTEADFRAEHRVDPDVQAFYNLRSNRIYLYESSARDEDAPDVAALRKPQTVAHEGTHQILQNIGIQPRLAPWPLWLVEGMAEYCAPTTTTKRGDWVGAGVINPFHMATIRDLNDPADPARPPGPAPTLETLITSKALDPADYARAWALTHFLATRRFPQFLAYLKEMGELAPLSERTDDEQKAAFVKHFGTDLRATERSMFRYLAGLKGYPALPYYAVTFEQPIGDGMVRRGAMVSQSPAMVNGWLAQLRAPGGGIPVWRAWPYPTKARANQFAEQWLKSAGR